MANSKNEMISMISIVGGPFGTSSIQNGPGLVHASKEASQTLLRLLPRLPF